jgi:hypothetical protein
VKALIEGAESWDWADMEDDFFDSEEAFGEVCGEFSVLLIVVPLLTLCRRWQCLRGDTSRRRALDVWLITFERIARRYSKRSVNSNLHGLDYLMKEYHRFFLFVCRNTHGKEKAPEEPFLPPMIDERACNKCYALDTCMLFRKVRFLCCCMGSADVMATVC